MGYPIDSSLTIVFETAQTLGNEIFVTTALSPAELPQFGANFCTTTLSARPLAWARQSRYSAEDVPSQEFILREKVGQLYNSIKNPSTLAGTGEADGSDESWLVDLPSQCVVRRN